MNGIDDNIAYLDGFGEQELTPEEKLGLFLLTVALITLFILLVSFT